LFLRSSLAAFCGKDLLLSGLGYSVTTWVEMQICPRAEEAVSSVKQGRSRRSAAVCHNSVVNYANYTFFFHVLPNLLRAWYYK